jgi:hypothetical protein
MRRWSVWMAVALGMALLGGCGGNNSSSGSAQLRLLNASVGYPSLDLLVNGTVQNSAVAYGTAGNYVGVSTDAITTSVAIAGSGTSLSTASRTLGKDVHYTQVAYGWQGAIKTALIQEDTAAAPSGSASLSVLNLAPDAGNVDVYLSGANDPISNATLVATNVAGGSGSGFSQVSAGTYRLRVTGYGNNTDLRLDVQGLTLSSTQVATLILTSTSGGLLVNAIGMQQQSTVSAYTNTLARARVVAAVSGNGKVDATLTAGDGTVVPLATGLISPNPYSNYSQVQVAKDSSGNPVPVPISLAVNGKALTLPDQTFAFGGDYTVLVWGDAANPSMTLIADDNRLPTNSSNAKIRLINALWGTAAAPLTLVSDIAGTMATNVVQGNASPYYPNLPASTSVRLSVLSPLQPQPLVDLQNQNIIAKGVYSMYVFGDPTATTATSPLPYALLKER